MKRHFPLYGRILVWFFLNVAAVAGVTWWLLRTQFRFTALPAGAAAENVKVAAEQILTELKDVPMSEWNRRVQAHAILHRVSIRMISGTGRLIAGPQEPLPPEVHARIFGMPSGDRPGPDGRRPPRAGPGGGPPGGPGGPPGGPGPRRGPPPFGDEPGNRPPPMPMANLPEHLVVKSANPDRYWVIVRMTTSHPSLANGVLFLFASESPTGHGFYFDVTPYVGWGVAILGLSVAIWFPFVRSLTRSISRMRRTTAQLAEGRFDARVDERRRDEVGELGGEINRMARRLEGYMDGQKRFLSDVAHELCAPIARLQMAIAILEQRASREDDRERLADVREEVEHMGSLVNELLQFSRASAGALPIALQVCSLRPIVEKAVRREAGDTSQVVIDLDSDLHVRADADLLLRAIGNLVRNAIRYAGHAGPITVGATADASRVTLTVRDNGPGIPEEALPHVFEPFYRVDTVRTPGAGGAGLGLAIVQTCVEACQGIVRARNLPEGGLEVAIELAADQPPRENLPSH